QKLRGTRIGNGALIALDYQTGEILAYVGSADYDAPPTPLLQPKFDVLSDGWRQPGSAFKPLMYATGIDSGAITAGSMLMDVTTDFGGGYAPTDADGLERGPVRVRNALEFSLNIPAVKAIQVVGESAVFARATDLGLHFQSSTPSAGPSMALGTEVVHPIDLATAYATLANAGGHVGHTSILRVTASDGSDALPAYRPPTPRQVVSAGAAAIVTDILAGNTDPRTNPYWGRFQLTSGGTRRPATLKTGTNDQARDLNAYGFIAPPDAAGRQAGEHALVVGVWNGNSDDSLVTTANRPIFSSDVSTYVWQGFMSEATKGWRINDFTIPPGVVSASIDPWTGLLASPGGPAVRELFIDGTQPKQTVEQTGVCGTDLLGRVGFEAAHQDWLAADQAWLARAAQGPGVVGGPKNTATAYFYEPGFEPYGPSWGAFLGPTCPGSPSPSPSESPSASPSESASPSPSSSASASPSPSPAVPSPSPAPSVVPSPSLSPKPSPSPSPAPSVGLAPSTGPAVARAGPSG
ncbi:MAG TPA: penicillin-binding transpeptidase domain-containing protein, partial [Candidatus Dormibacteraeota bacterium]|nr:penicillin-binding transpeptidase domain-containing protein [Candidatus Dormibacteraeota bacterium]